MSSPLPSSGRRSSLTWSHRLLRTCSPIFAERLLPAATQVVDTNPHAKVGQYDDVSQVEKFELSEQEYASRRDTVRAFKERNKMGRFNPETAAAMVAKVREVANGCVGPGLQCAGRRPTAISTHCLRAPALLTSPRDGG